MSDHVILPWLVPLVLILLYRTRSAAGAAAGDRRTAVLVAAGALLVGVWQLEGALLPQWRAREAQAWTSTTGTVVYSQVQTTTPGRRSRWRNNSYANVGTEFAAGGVVDTAWRVGLTRGAGPAEDARSLAARYAVGARVPVFYDPARPWDAVLDREAPPVSLGRIALGTFLTVGALGTLVLGLGRRRRTEPLVEAWQ